MAMIVANPRGELNPVLTVGRQIAAVVETHLGIGRREADELALKMLVSVNIPDAKRRFKAYPHELSGGMAQRVVIAMALVCSPRFVISDDATSGLDVTVQAQILDLLRNLVRDSGTSMLYITRDVGVAANFCDRIAILYKGELVEVAPTVSFFSGPLHPYSNMLLAAFSHNPRLRNAWTSAEISGQHGEPIATIVVTRRVAFAGRSAVCAIHRRSSLWTARALPVASFLS